MNCRQARENLELYVFGGLSPQQHCRVREHLGQCPACREAKEQIRRIADDVKCSGDADAPSVAFEYRLQDAVSREIKSKRFGRRIRRVITVFGAAAVLIAAVSLWGIISGESQPRKTSASNGFLEKWRYEGAMAARASTADGFIVNGDNMYFVAGDDTDGHVVAVDAATGESKWTCPARSFGYLAADGKRVFCLAKGQNGQIALLALDAADGGKLWQSIYRGRGHTIYPSRPSPLGQDRVCWTVGREVRMLNASTGEVKWTRSFEREGLPSRAANRNGYIYVATAGRLMRLEASSGHILWRREFEDSRFAIGRPLVALGSGRIYFAQTELGMDSKLFCIDENSRRTLWRRAVSPTRCLLTTSEGLYLRGRNVTAIDRRTGRVLWKRAAEGCSPLSETGGLIYYVDTRRNGRLVALDRRTGKIVRRIPGVLSCNAFASVGDTGYIKTRDGTVHAIVMAEPGRS